MKNHSKTDTLSFLDKYSIFKKNMDSEDTILKDKATGGLVLMREVVVEDNENFKRIIETLEGQKDLKHNHLLYLLEYHIKSIQEDSCSFHKVITFYEYSHHSLMEELEARHKDNRPFEESELWNILCSVVLGLSYLQKQNIGHGSVSLLDMYITPDGLVKIADPSIASSSPFNFMEGYYYSPEILKYYATNSQIQTVNFFKSDVFSLAVCMIQATLLEPVDDCIDYDNFEINFDILQNRLQIIGQSYSEQYVAVLAQMLSEEPVDRPDLLAMEQKLMSIWGQDEMEIHQSLNAAKTQPQLLGRSASDPEDGNASREGFPDTNCVDSVSTPDEALYVPGSSQASEQRQTNLGNQNITLQSSIRGHPAVEKSIQIQQTIKIDKYPTVTVIPNNSAFVKYKLQSAPTMAKRDSEDIKITVLPPPPPTPSILKERSRPTSNYQPSSLFNEGYLKQNQSSGYKAPEYPISQITIQSQNRPYNYTEQTMNVIQQSKYGSPSTYIPSYTSISAVSNFQKKTVVNGTNGIGSVSPGINPVAGGSKFSYGLNQLAPLQSQSIQINQGPSLGGHLGQPLLANTKLAPMITSNAVTSKDNAHLFTDPKLLNMMRADLKRFQTYNIDITTDYSKPYYRY